MKCSIKSDKSPKFLFRVLSTLGWDPNLNSPFLSSSSKLEKANGFWRGATADYMITRNPGAAFCRALLDRPVIGVHHNNLKQKVERSSLISYVVPLVLHPVLIVRLCSSLLIIINNISQMEMSSK